MLKDLWFWAIMSVANIAALTTSLSCINQPDWGFFFGGVIGILIQITIDVLILRRYFAYKTKKNTEVEA